MGYTLLLVLLGGLVGAFLGWFAFKQYNKFFSRKLEKRARGVIDGDIENKFELDGKKEDVNTFIFREKEGDEFVETKIKLTNLKNEIQ